VTFDALAAAEAGVGDYPAFDFIGLDGKTYSLPHPLTLTERQVSRIREGQFDVVLGEVSAEAADAIQNMPVFVSSQLAEEWMGSAGEAGKSPAPSRATRRSVKPSKRTSPRVA